MKQNTNTSTKIILFLFIGLFFNATSISIHAQNAVEFTAFPKNQQLYTRDLVTNKGTVVVAGTALESSKYRLLRVKVYRQKILQHTYGAPLNYENGKATFRLEVPITAELANYDFEALGYDGVKETYANHANNVVSGDVYIVNGQSNAIGTAEQSDWDEFLRSHNAAWGWNYINYSHPSRWAPHIAKNIIDEQKIPVAIFNEAEGAQTIDYFLKNEAYPKSGNYGVMAQRLEQAGIKKVRAAWWFQGESDGWLTPPEDYKARYKTLHNAWVKDYGIEKSFLYQIRFRSCTHISPVIMEAQRQIANEMPDVKIMSTNNAAHDGCHFYYHNGYDILANRMYDLVARHIYNHTPINNIDAPDIKRAFRSGTNEITLEMKNVRGSLQVIGFPWFDFQTEGKAVTITGGAVLGNLIQLKLAGSNDGVTGISYLSHIGAENHWIVNQRGVGSLSFHNFPIDGAGTIEPTEPTTPTEPPVTDNKIVDLELSAATDKLRLSLYGNITFIVKVTNKGNSTASNVSVSAPILDDIFANTGAHTVSKGVFNYLTGNWKIGTLAAGETVTLNFPTFVLKVAPVNKFFEILTASPKDTDSTPANGKHNEDDEAEIVLQLNGDTGTTPPTPPTPTPPTSSDETDIEVKMNTTATNISLYTSISYAVVVTNKGNNTAKNVVVATNALEKNAFVSKKESLGHFNPYCINGDKCEKWTIPTLAPNQSATLEMAIFILDTNASFSITARLLSVDQNDNNSTNNNASLTFAKSRSSNDGLIESRSQDLPAQIESVFPMPVTESMTIAIESLDDKKTALNIFNSMGQLIYNQAIALNKGKNQVTINTSPWAAGLYLLQIGEMYNEKVKILKL